MPEAAQLVAELRSEPSLHPNISSANSHTDRLSLHYRSEFRGGEPWLSTAAHPCKQGIHFCVQRGTFQGLANQPHLGCLQARSYLFGPHCILYVGKMHVGKIPSSPHPKKFLLQNRRLEFRGEGGFEAWSAGYVERGGELDACMQLGQAASSPRPGRPPGVTICPG